MPLLTDLDTAVRKSGLVVRELPGWEKNWSAGAEEYLGVGIHHTGAYDEIGDTSSDEAYARWMAFEGRSGLPAPLCNLALSAESVVWVCASGNANGMGTTKAVGPMPYRKDGNGLYIVIEAMNSGTQGWGTRGKDASGREITQYNGYVRLCAALCSHYGWPASHVRAHWETSVTGKWDPGDPNGINFNGQKVMDMDRFRAEVARVMRDGIEEDDVSAEDVWNHKIGVAGEDAEITAKAMQAQTHLRAAQAREAARAALAQANRNRDAIEAGFRKLDALAPGVANEVVKALGDKVEIDVVVRVEDSEGS